VKLCLCSTFNDKQKRLPKGTWLIEPKYDGLRCIATKQNGKVTFISRNGKAIYNTEIIQAELEKAPIDNVVFDGELQSKDWSDTISIAHTQATHPSRDKLCFYIFDSLALNEWTGRVSKHYLIDRREGLLLAINEHIKVVPANIVNTFQEAEALYKSYLEREFEGVVLKEINSFYEWRKHKQWLKWKPIKTYDIKVIDKVEGLGKYQGRLGALIVLHKSKKIKVGSGFTDEQRYRYWSQDIIGKVIEVKCQEETKDGYLRFPVFVRLREDKV